MRKRFGFTLAEVLITLGIIGVVAAMTIPALVKNTQDKEFRTAFKKTFSALSQAVLSISFDNGGSIAGMFSDENTFRDVFTNFFSVVKTCNDGDSSCWTCNGAKTDYFYNGKAVGGALDITRPVIVLKDGAIINTAYISSTCTGTDAGIIAPYAGTICGAIFVDVNGCKPPNTWGRDIYYIEVQQNKIFGLGPSSDNNAALACNKLSGTTYAGTQCAEFALRDQDY